MSVVISDLKIYGSASMPDVDGATTGGALAAKKIDFTDPTAAGTFNYVSSSASDTAVVLTATGRDASGTPQAEGKTLTGTTVVTGSQTFERLLKGVATGTGAVGDVAIISNTKVLSAQTCQTGSANETGVTPPIMKMQSGNKASVAVGMIVRMTNNTPAGVNFQLREIISVDAALGTDIVAINRDWGTVPDNTSTYDVHQGMLFDLLPTKITEVRRPFYNVAADIPGGSTRIYYEKVFAVNMDTVLALTVASIIKQVDPSAGTLDFALCTALNDTTTAANRQTAPSGIGSFSSGAAPQTIAVPAPQNLPQGATPNAAGAQGIWLRLTLAAGTAPTKTSETTRITGQTA